MKIEVSPRAIDALAVEGFDPVYGARPLKRLIQKKLQDRIAMKLLSGEIRPGETIHIDWDSVGRDLVFAPAVSPEAAGR